MSNATPTSTSAATHVPTAIQTTQAGGTAHVVVVAAAAHSESKLISHGYNLAALVADSAGRIKLRVWPRRWYPSWREFRVDAHQVPDREVFFEQNLSTSTPRFGVDVRPAQSGSFGSVDWTRVNWDDLLRGAARLDVAGIACNDLVASGPRAALHSFLQGGGHLRLMLADPDAPSISSYDVAFEQPHGARRRRVADTLRELITLEGAEIWVTRRTFWYSAYRIDDDVMFVPYAMKPGRNTPNIPVFAARKRVNLAEAFVHRDLDWLFSEPVDTEGVPYTRRVTSDLVQAWAT